MSESLADIIAGVIALSVIGLVCGFSLGTVSRTDNWNHWDTVGVVSAFVCLIAMAGGAVLGFGEILAWAVQP